MEELMATQKDAKRPSKTKDKGKRAVSRPKSPAKTVRKTRKAAPKSKARGATRRPAAAKTTKIAPKKSARRAARSRPSQPATRAKITNPQPTIAQRTAAKEEERKKRIEARKKERAERTEEIRHEQTKTAVAVLVIWGITLILSLLASIWIAGYLGIPIAIALWLIFFGLTFKYFIVDLPLKRGLVTVDRLRKDTNGNKKLTIHGPGLSFRLPTERVDAENKIDLSIRTETFEVTIPTSDGPEIILRGSWQWQPDPLYIDRFVFIKDDPSTMTRGVRDEVANALATVVGRRQVESALNKTGALSKVIGEHFEKVRDNSSDEKRSLEHEFGILITTPTIAEPRFESNYQNARATRRSVKELRRSAHEARHEHEDGTGDSVPYGEAMKNVMLVHPGARVSEHIQGIRGENLGEQLASLLVAIFGNKVANSQPRGGR